MAEITHINRYSNSKIYKICSNLSNKIYIGSTTQSIQQRLSEHVGAYKTHLKNNNTNYVSSYEIIKFGDAFITLLEQCNFNNRQQLERKEGEYIKQNINIAVNKVIAGRTGNEYHNDNKEKEKQYSIDNAEHIAERQKNYRTNNTEHLKEYKKKYDTNNAENIKENHKEYYNNNKTILAEKNKEYRTNNKENIKQYLLNNAEHIAERQKEYRTNNAEHIAEKQKQYNLINAEHIAEKNKEYYNNNRHYIQCECGLTIQKYYINNHKQTNKHLTLIYYNELNFYNL
jgi:hypothetical protein